jgi:transcriptional regulator with XRE-family HTH domain
MARKATTKPDRYQRSYIRQWRTDRGLTLAQLVSRIVELAGEGTIEDPSKQVPRTEASLSRIETGKQPYTQGILEVVGEALQVHPAWLLERDPTKEGKVISMLDRANPAQMAQIEAVVEAILRTAVNG